MRFRDILFALLVVGLFSTCETEIDITSDYEKVPVIYGLLDPSVDKQIILINRTFLGNVNAQEVVTEEDSMLYDNVQASIEWYNENGTLVGSAALNDTTLQDKDVNGIFYAPTAVAYTVNSTAIWEDWNDWQNTPVSFDEEYRDYTYRLNIIADGESITAETKMASTIGSGNGAIEQPIATDQSILLVTSFSPGGSTYNGNFRVVWNAGTNDVENAIKQKVDVRFNYREVYTDDTFQDKFVEFEFAREDITIPGEEVEEARNGRIFFERIASALEAEGTPSNLRYREIGTFDFILSVAGEGFTTYLNIGESDVSAVGQSRPTFSNINNGEGIGIFSSRDIYVRTKTLYNQGNEPDLREMVEGQFTQNLCFCDATGESIEFSCDDPANWCQ